MSIPRIVPTRSERGIDVEPPVQRDREYMKRMCTKVRAMSACGWGWTLWRSFTCELLGAQWSRRRRPRLKIIGGCQITAKRARSAVSRDWRSSATDSSGRGCGKHLGHRTARCSLRGNSSSCSARPQPHQGSTRKSAWRCPTERGPRFSAPLFFSPDAGIVI